MIREGPGSGLILERWDHRYFDPCARLIQLAYANHVDGEINDQYRSESGALRFLKNIIILPGCGKYLSRRLRSCSALPTRTIWWAWF